MRADSMFRLRLTQRWLVNMGQSALNYRIRKVEEVIDDVM